LTSGDWHDRERIIEGSHYNANGTLFHGPSFRGVEKLLLVSREKVVMQVRLPAVPQKIQGQFPVQTGNPFVYDAIVQSLLIWAQQYYKAPCLPSSMEKLEQFKAIPFDQPLRVTLEITHDRESSVAGNLLVQSLSGKLYARITRLVGTISPLLNRFIGARS